MKEITLLLLGETGVGKSTWINGFANFHQFDLLDKAEESPIFCLIPASFTMTDENYEERVVAVGSDTNEVATVGQSATQQPQTYTFTKDNQIIRIIDTPGIGDVRGVEQDKKNFKLILNHISHLEVLDGICILLKPNNARLNIMFSFCIKELLTNLHRDACRNILFCFTNSRSTFYRPGDTLPGLKKLIAENKDVDIPLNQSTLYCMDNESIRFLYALKSNIKFTEDERKNYAISWEKSVLEVNRLLEHVGGLSPHQVKNTLSLNNARQTILALEYPLMEISRSVQTNIALREKQKTELLTSQKSKEELAKNLIITKTEVEKKILSKPKTICTRCVEVIPVGHAFHIKHTNECHRYCTRCNAQKHFEMVEIVGHKSLRWCSAFTLFPGSCKMCGCSWKVHKKILHETKIRNIQEPNVEKVRELTNSESAIQKIEYFVGTLDNQIRELREEQNEITNASAMFACFLKNNAITPYNNSMLEYQGHFINEERTKVCQGADPKVLEGLMEMRKVYEQEMKLLEEAIKMGHNESVSPQELDNLVNRLFNLKHCGNNLKELMNSSVETQASFYIEKKIERIPNFSVTTVSSGKKRPNPIPPGADVSKNSCGTQANANKLNSNKKKGFGFFSSTNKEGARERDSQGKTLSNSQRRPPVLDKTHSNQKICGTHLNSATKMTGTVPQSLPMETMNISTKHKQSERNTLKDDYGGTFSILEDSVCLKPDSLKSAKAVTEALLSQVYSATPMGLTSTESTKQIMTNVTTPLRQHNTTSLAKLTPSHTTPEVVNNLQRSPLVEMQAQVNITSKPIRTTRPSVAPKPKIVNANSKKAASHFKVLQSKIAGNPVPPPPPSNLMAASTPVLVETHKPRAALLDQIRQGIALKKVKEGTNKENRRCSDSNVEAMRLAMERRAELMCPSSDDLDDEVGEQVSD